MFEQCRTNVWHGPTGWTYSLGREIQLAR